MRVLGLLLLLAGCLVLLWPTYGYLFETVSFSRSNSQMFGGLALMGGVLALLIAMVRAR